MVCEGESIFTKNQFERYKCSHHRVPEMKCRFVVAFLTNKEKQGRPSPSKKN